MSDIHPLPLVGHDLVEEPLVRAVVWKSGAVSWWWSYEEEGRRHPLQHGPFGSQPEAFASAYRMVELL